MNNKIWRGEELTAELVTNFYLYGTDSTPGNLVDETLIRPETTKTVLKIDKQDFMTTGPGKLALAPQFELIRLFFDTPSSELGWTGENEVKYSKDDLAKNKFGLSYYGWNMQHYNWTDRNKDDRAERTYIFNSQEFWLAELSETEIEQLTDSEKEAQELTFVINEDGSKEIRNLQIEPLLGTIENEETGEEEEVPDNFDFESSDLITILGNNFVLEPLIDPSGIGRRVDFDYVGEVTKVPIYDRAAFDRDVQKIENDFSYKKLNLANPVDISELYYLIVEVSDELFEAGVTRFLDDQNRAVFYGTLESDIYELDSSYPIFPTLNEYIVENGVVAIGADASDRISLLNQEPFNNNKLLGGSGNDTLNGDSGKDEIYGNEDNDLLNGNGNNDTLIGGSGNDRLNGQDGDDSLIGGSGDDTLNGNHGADRLEGNSGSDLLTGWVGRHTLIGGEGNDTLYAGDGFDKLQGGSDNDLLFGERNDDTLIGGSGNDTLDGGFNKDVAFYQ